jgi:uncharacterized membrane protein
MRRQSKGDGSVSLLVSFISATMVDDGLSFLFEAIQSRLYFVSLFLLLFSLSLSLNLLSLFYSALLQFKRKKQDESFPKLSRQHAIIIVTKRSLLGPSHFEC